LLILDEPGDGLDPEGTAELRATILRLHRELGLTILLSSHLLNEVEQLCTSIAVLNQGRKVFEGPIAEATGRHHWVRLRVDNFADAVKGLRAAGLVTRDSDGRLIALAEGATAAQVVKHLVGQGMAVHEIAVEEETLESFYLTLMEAERSRLGRASG
jgi:ABC-2 type transport system ATP-binding protein